MRPRLQQLSRKLSARERQMLAVVEYEQQSSILDELDQGLRHRAPEFFLDAQHRRNSLRNQPCVNKRRKLDEPHAVRILVDHVGGDLQRRTRLAQPTDAVQRHEPCLMEQVLDLSELALAPHERRQLMR